MCLKIKCTPQKNLRKIKISQTDHKIQTFDIFQTLRQGYEKKIKSQNKEMMGNKTFPSMLANLLGGLILLAHKMDLPRYQTKSSNKQENKCYLSLAYD